MTTQEAIKFALEALEKDPVPLNAINNAKYFLRQALAQPEQVSIEPPDYVEPITFDYHEGWEEGFKAGVGSAKNKKESTPSNVDPLLHGGDGNYIKQAQPEQEPVAYVGEVSEGAELMLDKPNGWEAIPLYTAPPKREWVGLTDEEREQATGWSVEHIEAKLKEKNGG